jgi:pimeloyl-ACP methyl ester carboxylesterase
VKFVEAGWNKDTGRVTQLSRYGICYEAVQRVYRNAVLTHARQVLPATYSDWEERLKHTFAKEWHSLEASASERRWTGELGTELHDAFDLLGVNHFYNLFEAYFDALVPIQVNEPARARQQERQALLGWLREIKALRDPISHPSESDLEYADAFRMLDSACRVLQKFDLAGARQVEEWRDLLDPQAELDRAALYQRTHRGDSQLLPKRPEVVVRSTTSKDGHQLAYAATGTGPVLVWISEPPGSHVSLEWRQPILREAYDWLTRHCCFVRYDERGLGMSGRRISSFTQEERVADLAAVVDATTGDTGLTQDVILLGIQTAGGIAVQYAALHPERVSHLILMDCLPRGLDLVAPPSVSEAMTALLDRSWSRFVEQIPVFAFGPKNSGGQEFADLIRESVDPITYRTIMFPAIKTMDAQPFLSAVRAPTLLIEHTKLDYIPGSARENLRQSIAGARVLAIQSYALQEIPQLTAGIADFLRW